MKSHIRLALGQFPGPLVLAKEGKPMLDFQKKGSEEGAAASSSVLPSTAVPT